MRWDQTPALQVRERKRNAGMGLDPFVKRNAGEFHKLAKFGVDNGYLWDYNASNRISRVEMRRKRRSAQHDAANERKDEQRNDDIAQNVRQMQKKIEAD